MVIASPAAICPANALSFRTGLLERSMFAMEESPISRGGKYKEYHQPVLIRREEAMKTGAMKQDW
jgi:hypothetical protein